jgi:uncharacterized DUF497 family protein
MERASVAFEFDPAKSAENLAKHGIDFEAAQAIWLDENAIDIEARSETELRAGVVGMIEDRCWTAFFTVRGQAIRIISVRRARDYEVEAYERKQDG